MNSSREFEVLPTTYVYGGDVLARLPDGRAVFIPYALPGEKVRIRLVEEKERFARGEIIEILEPSPQRITARCSHFQECGGCHYQHLPYSEQLLLKEKIMVDQFTRVGKLENPPVLAVRPSPLPWNYRNHVQFHITEEGQPGFLKGHSSEIIPIQECHLPEESLNEIWPSFNFEHIPGLDRVSLRAGEGGEDTLLVMESTSAESFEFSVDLPLSAVLQEPDQEIILAGDDFTVMPILGFPFVVSAGSFFQTNNAVAEMLVEAVIEKLPLTPESLVLDVYCGVGLFSVFLAQRVKKVIGIESSPSAAEDFLYNLADYENVELYDLPAEEVLPALDVQPEVILLDPPRAGLSREVLDQVVAMDPHLIAYISCDPATLARDALRLHKGGYRLLESTPFDMFPQTYHIESLNIFQRA